MKKWSLMLFPILGTGEMDYLPGCHLAAQPHSTMVTDSLVGQYPEDSVVGSA